VAVQKFLPFMIFQFGLVLSIFYAMSNTYIWYKRRTVEMNKWVTCIDLFATFGSSWCTLWWFQGMEFLPLTGWIFICPLVILSHNFVNSVVKNEDDNLRAETFSHVAS
jgi:hypothetical protein